MPYKDRTKVEFITFPVDKGTKARLRVFAADNGFKGVSELVRVSVDAFIKGKCKGEAIAVENEGKGEI